MSRKRMYYFQKMQTDLEQGEMVYYSSILFIFQMNKDGVKDRDKIKTENKDKDRSIKYVLGRCN